ncbi:MAG: YjdF family protein, partial [Clostridia bacterium]|nr:YjdF family protein [Clostridia bacterium]
QAIKKQIEERKIERTVNSKVRQEQMRADKFLERQKMKKEKPKGH